MCYIDDVPISVNKSEQMLALSRPFLFLLCSFFNRPTLFQLYRYDLLVSVISRLRYLNHYSIIVTNNLNEPVIDLNCSWIIYSMSKCFWDWRLIEPLQITIIFIILLNLYLRLYFVILGIIQLILFRWYTLKNYRIIEL